MKRIAIHTACSLLLLAGQASAANWVEISRNRVSTMSEPYELIVVHYVDVENIKRMAALRYVKRKLRNYFSDGTYWKQSIIDGYTIVRCQQGIIVDNYDNRKTLMNRNEWWNKYDIKRGYRTISPVVLKELRTNLKASLKLRDDIANGLFNTVCNESN